MADKSSLHVIEDTEVLVDTIDLNNIHDTSGKVRVGPDGVVNLHQPLVGDLLGLFVVESVLQSVTQNQHKGERLPQLVRSWARTRSEHTISLAQQP